MPKLTSRHDARAILGVALLALFPNVLFAQEAVRAGARIRVSTASLGATTGRMLAISNDSLLIGSRGNSSTPFALARTDIKSFQLSLGGNGMRGATIGAQLGLAAGAIAFGFEHLASRRPPPRFAYDNGDLAFASLSGAVWGFAVGGVAGAIIGQERWIGVPLPRQSDDALPAFDSRPALQTQIRLGLLSTETAVRIRTTNGQQIQGMYRGYENGVVRVESDSTYELSVSSITEISDRQRMTGPWLRRGALIGAALGGLLMGVAVAGSDCDDPDFCVGAPAGWVVWGVLVGGPSGAVLGTIFGSHIDGWRPQKW